MRPNSQLDNDPSWWDEESILMAIDLGYDEGGSGDTLLVSVQIGITEQAKRFKRHWKKRLGSVEHFHSKDLWNFTKGPFTKAGLDRKERMDLLNDLGKFIHTYLSAGVTAKISQKLYDNNTTHDFRSQEGSAYSCAVNSLLLCAYLCMKKMNLRPEVNILIERGHRNASGAVLLLNKWKDAPSVPHLKGLKILTVGLGSKEDHPILQAADMLAYCKYQQLIQRDRFIYEALHREGSKYHPEEVAINLDLIQEFQKGPAAFKKHKKEYWFKSRKGQ